MHWADENGALSDWQSFAYLPIETNSVGMYKMEGCRATPRDATHVLARAVSADFSAVEECLAPIPKLAEKSDEPLQLECWTEGNLVELLAGENQTIVTGISMKTGQRIARGHYFFKK